MAMLRGLLVVVLMTAVLPWGAFRSASAFEIAPDGRGSASYLPEGTTDTDRASGVVKPAKRCKGPALLGSPCGVAVVAPEVAGLPDRAFILSIAWFLRSELRHDGITPENGLDPPILA